MDKQSQKNKKGDSAKKDNQEKESCNSGRISASQCRDTENENDGSACKDCKD